MDTGRSILVERMFPGYAENTEITGFVSTEQEDERTLLFNGDYYLGTYEKAKGYIRAIFAES